MCAEQTHLSALLELRAGSYLIELVSRSKWFFERPYWALASDLSRPKSSTVSQSFANVDIRLSVRLGNLPFARSLFGSMRRRKTSKCSSSLLLLHSSASATAEQSSAAQANLITDSIRATLAPPKCHRRASNKIMFTRRDDYYLNDDADWPNQRPSSFHFRAFARLCTIAQVPPESNIALERQFAIAIAQ